MCSKLGSERIELLRPFDRMAHPMLVGGGQSNAVVLSQATGVNNAA